MSRNDTGFALDTEPAVFFHPLLAGRSAPGGVQPVTARLLLEEEPATWPEPSAERPPQTIRPPR